MFRETANIPLFNLDTSIKELKLQKIFFDAKSWAETTKCKTLQTDRQSTK